MAKIIHIPQRVFAAHNIALHLCRMIIREKGFCCVAATEESQAKIDAMT